VSPEPSQPSCANCGATLTDQATICHACTGRLTADLASTADLLAELDTTITRQARITAPAKGNGDKPLPYDVGASAAATALRTALHGWARILHEETATPYPAGNAAVPAWLARHVDVIRLQEWAAEMAHDIKRAVDAGWRAVDRQEERYYAGPCGNQVNDPAGYYVCPTVLWVKLDAPRVTCRTCAGSWDVAERREHLVQAASDHWLGVAQAASLASLVTRSRVTVAVVTGLAASGYITAALKLNADDPDLYRVADVLAGLRYADDHKPGTATEVVTWLRDVHGIDLGPAGKDRIRQWAARYPDDIARDGRLYERVATRACCAVALRLRYGGKPDRP
jgi:hypothetical protein